MKTTTTLLFVLFLFLPAYLAAQGLKSFQLNNGLTVFVWEDATQPDIFGMVSVKTGSVNDPAEFTGLAHYLEHLMFKGTNRIGSLDWNKEQAVYEQIIAKYDERALETDPAKKAAIDREINRLTVEQSQISLPNEFSNLVESIGGTGLNAGTSYDYTVYLNAFPKNQLEKWLDLYSVRLMNPVFRTFQTELETVYEEYNMYMDNRMRQTSNFILEQAFPGHPYARPIIGLGDHLKNPQISKLIEFYNNWYVPENMALILVGDLKTEELVQLINRKFGRLPAVSVPEKPTYVKEELKGRKQVTATVGQFPRAVLIYNGVASGHKDKIALEIVGEMLSNRNKTGLLDKLSLDGDLMYASASLASFADMGRFIIEAVPAFDYNQRRFESHRMVERMLLDQLKKLADGQIEDWLLESVKNNMIRTYDLMLESSRGKANVLSNAFVSDQGIDQVLDYEELVQSVSMDDINRVLKEFLNNNYLALHISEGKNAKTEKISKPKFEHTVDMALNEKSLYASWLQNVPTSELEVNYADFNDVTIKPVNEKSQLFYYPNPANQVFSMTIKYGIGERELPKLAYATQLMNNAGVLAAFDPQEFRSALSQLNAVCSYSSDDDYTYVRVEGTEEQLSLICNLITRQILMPKLDEKQLNNLKGQLVQARRIEKEEPDAMQDALSQYIRYQDRSDYINRISESEVTGLTISELTGEFQRATDYAAEIHYTGKLSFDEVYDILSKNLPLKANELDSRSPQVKEPVNYKESKIFFLPNSDVQQSRIVFYAEGPVFSPGNHPQLYAFNQYFGGGFGGLVMTEIREKNSMAYTATGTLVTPPLTENKSYFSGFIGTQGDKTVEAVELYMKLLTNMPENPDRMGNIQSFIRQALMTRQPGFRNASQTYESWKRQGYSTDPAQTIIPAIDRMTFNDIVKFYTENLKNSPVVIGIVGDPRQIDLKALEKFGPVERINTAKIFK